jgi:hypothetical protein
MAGKKNIDKIYQLIEQFDFNELPENDKIFILENISIEEYDKIRTTIADTRNLFLKYPESESKKTYGNFIKLLTYKIELYKIAATILLLIGIGFMFSKGRIPNHQGISHRDTVIVQKRDTLIKEKIDTIEKIVERIVYKDLHLRQNSKSFYYGTLETVNYKMDCSKEICPYDLARLSQIKTEGNLSKDTALMKFVVSLN